jgi:membrane protein YqaA with SNARE-associated domain
VSGVNPQTLSTMIFVVVCLLACLRDGVSHWYLGLACPDGLMARELQNPLVSAFQHSLTTGEVFPVMPSFYKGSGH